MDPTERFERFERHADRHQHVKIHGGSGIVPGLILVAIGALVFLNNLHIFYIREWLRFWPSIFVALGVVKLVDSTAPSGRAFGGVLAAVGALLLARNLGYLFLTWNDVWPLILIGMGLLMLFQRGFDGAAWVGKRIVTKGRLNEVAVFGGGKRVVTAQDFTGGEVNAVFGGFELDLRQADIAGDTAELEINAIFGGVELKIPQMWSAVVQGVGVFGGYSDSTMQPNPLQFPGAKRLIIKGGAVFGGVDVKN